jgi:hypothetical protein
VIAGPDAPLPPLKVRVGLPSPGGGLVRAARALGCAVMISANSFFRRDSDGEVIGVRRPGPDLRGLDASLDSSGYVAMRRYGGYGWTVEAYVRLVVAAFPWRWYSAPDYCCEPALAGRAADIRLRQAATVSMYHECRRVAADAGLPAPVPVLQGWRPDDYHRCWDLLGLQDEVGLLGLGSVCARPVHGPDGLMAILERVDRLLPSGVQLHLYGVKSTALDVLLAEAALDGRVRSVDSMAWDVEARARFRTGRTIERRAGVMREWYECQSARAAAAASRAQYGLPRTCFLPPTPPPPSLDPLLDEYADLIAAGELDFHSAIIHYERAVHETASAPRLAARPGLRQGAPPPALHHPAEQTVIPLPSTALAVPRAA